MRSLHTPSPMYRWQQATYILQEIYEGVCGSHKRMGFGTKGVEIGILLAYNKKDA